MKVSKKTFEVLKNLAAFQNQLAIEPGRTLRARPNGALYIEATVEDTFPAPLTISDLPVFLKVVGLITQPEIAYDTQTLHVIDGENGQEKMKIPLAQASVNVPRVRKARPEVESVSIEFDLTEATWRKIEKAASVLYAPEIRIVSKDGNLSIFTHNGKVPNSPSYEIDVPPSRNDVTCNCILSLANARFLKGAYLVTVTSGYVRFKNISGHDVTYWIAHEHGSSFGS